MRRFFIRGEPPLAEPLPQENKNAAFPRVGFLAVMAILLFAVRREEIDR
jgi:hypothetical protein